MCARLSGWWLRAVSDGKTEEVRVLFPSMPVRICLGVPVFAEPQALSWSRGIVTVAASSSDLELGWLRVGPWLRVREVSTLDAGCHWHGERDRRAVTVTMTIHWQNFKFKFEVQVPIGNCTHAQKIKKNLQLKPSVLDSEKLWRNLNKVRMGTWGFQLRLVLVTVATAFGRHGGFHGLSLDASAYQLQLERAPCPRCECTTVTPSQYRCVPESWRFGGCLFYLPTIQ